jgi:hypothetical protein
MRIATWNLNNRVGKLPFRPEAADAAIGLGADVIVFTEFFPREQEDRFCTTLASAGWSNQRMSTEPKEKANRVFVASKLLLEPLTLSLPTFDQQFPSNLLAVRLPLLGLSIVGVRVPAYNRKSAHLLVPAWEWLESTTGSLKSSPSIVIGDLNVSLSRASCARNQFRRILASGWHRAEPTGGATFYGHGGKNSEIDHIIATPHCILSDALCVQQAGGFEFAGSSSAISDHAALVCNVEVTNWS